MENSKLANKLHQSVIDMILASPLNIDSIPDEIERALYEQILMVIDDNVSPSCLTRCCNRVKNNFTSNK